MSVLSTSSLKLLDSLEPKPASLSALKAIHFVRSYRRIHRDYREDYLNRLKEHTAASTDPEALVEVAQLWMRKRPLEMESLIEMIATNQRAAFVQELLRTGIMWDFVGIEARPAPEYALDRSPEWEDHWDPHHHSHQVMLARARFFTLTKGLGPGEKAFDRAYELLLRRWPSIQYHQWAG